MDRPRPSSLSGARGLLAWNTGASHLLSGHKGPVLSRVVVILTLQAASEEVRRIFAQRTNADLSVAAVAPLPDEKNPRVREH